VADPAPGVVSSPQRADGSAAAPARFGIPPNACDCHVHIYAPPGRYPLTPSRRYQPELLGLADYRALIARLGLRRAVIVQPTAYEGNEATVDALEAAGGAWRGIARLGPSTGPGELSRLHAAGIRGVRLHGRDNGLARLEQAAALVAPLGWHVQLHVEGDLLPDLLPRLRRLPTPVVIDHFGRIEPRGGIDQPGFRALLALLEIGQVWVKLSAPYRLGDDLPPYERVLPFARMLIEARPDRLVWGSDWPHSAFDGPRPDAAALLDLLAHWCPDAALRDAILVRNPATLYGFPA
jgi:predicted TIM-barrel fold metal-dependent hydrolase